MKKLDVLNVSISFFDNYAMANVKFDNGSEIYFSMNNDYTLFLLFPDGGAYDDVEADFKSKYGEESWYKEVLQEINSKLVAKRICSVCNEHIEHDDDVAGWNFESMMWPSHNECFDSFDNWDDYLAYVKK